MSTSLTIGDILIAILVGAVFALAAVGCMFVIGRVLRRRQDAQIQIELAAAGPPVEPPRPGLTEEQFARIPVVTFRKAECEGTPARNLECMISMEDFEDGDTILRLPCEHQLTYHLGLHYFQAKNVCPMCRFDVAAWLNAQEHPNSSSEVPIDDASVRSATPAIQDTTVHVAAASRDADERAVLASRSGRPASLTVQTAVPPPRMPDTVPRSPGGSLRYVNPIARRQAPAPRTSSRISPE